MRALTSPLSRACLAAFVLTIATGFPAQAQVETFTPVTDAVLQNPDPADWLMWRRTLDSWGYSPLDQVDRDNVDTLRMVWSRALGPGRQQQGTPLVYNGVMYMPNPRDLIQAIDAATGDLIWEHRRNRPDDGDVNGRFRALDHETGEVLWEINLGSPVTGFPMSYAVDGTQYVAVSTGNSITTGALRVLTPELRPSSGNNIFVFALP